MQKRAKQKEKEKEEKGFVLLFVALLSAVILAVGLEGADIAYREINFSTSARAANEAFFAADTGIECTLYYDKSTNNYFVQHNSSPTINCANNAIPLPDSYPFWSFTVPNLNSDGKGCAIVTVDKTDSTRTVINSKGYNTCASSSNQVERELNVEFKNP